MKKRIGFIDFYLSEWHANNYPKWIRELRETSDFDWEIAYAWAEKDVSPLDEVTTDEWCEKMGVVRCATPEELCEKSDAVMILAPSDPEKHRSYAEIVIPYGKPTYIDKTFAPNAQIAAEIFALAVQYHTPVFSTSALRYAAELDALLEGDRFLISGGGSNFSEYVVHQAEIAEVLLREPVTRVKAERHGSALLCTLETEREKEALLIYAPRMPFSVHGEFCDGRSMYASLRSGYFQTLMQRVLTFFETREPPVSSEQTMEVMRIRDALLSASEKCGEWLNTKGEYDL